MFYLNFLTLFCLLAGSYGLKKPNVVLFLTDDQDVVLGGMTPMKNVEKYLIKEGVTFTNSYTPSPICCPSRAGILTGLYPHNHNTRNNSMDGGCYGDKWKKHEKNTFATVLQTAGYSTFYAGKYLNQYGTKAAGGPEVVPPGWTDWHGLVGNSVYYNYTLSNNGVPTWSDDLYLTDVISGLAATFIEKSKDSPFLMVLAPPAPHQPFEPAQRHNGFFSNVTAARPPNFNIAVEDKHWLLRMPPSPLPDTMIPELDRVYRSRWETLLAVDDMVATVAQALEHKGLLDETYLIFTSDNGYHIGQFSQVYDKRQPYESDIKVPLIISGPNIPKASTNAAPALNIDLAPTIISLAGLVPPSNMDGHALDFERGGERNMLIEYQGEGSDGTVDSRCRWKYDGDNLSECYPQYDCKCQDSRNNTYNCLRRISSMDNIKYCVFAQGHNQYTFEEVYDLKKDPFELKNIVGDTLPAFRAWYNIQMTNLYHCKGHKDCDAMVYPLYSVDKV